MTAGRQAMPDETSGLRKPSRRPEECCALVFGINWPSWTNGTGIALQSSLRVYAEVFRSVRFVALTDTPAPEAVPAALAGIHLASIPVRRARSAVRFAASLCSRSPACMSQFLRPTVRRSVLDTVANAVRQDSNVVLIFEHLHPTVLLPLIRRTFPRVRVACRSYDVLTLAFGSLAMDAGLFGRTAWKVEIARIRRLEKNTARLCEAFWAITPADAVDYARHLGVDTAGVFGVAMPTHRYANVPAGSPQRVLHIGGSDLRKMHGLRVFLRQVWPRVVTQCRDAHLLLAGRGSERLDRPEQNVHGLGYVPDDTEFLSRGSVFVNPQLAGSGIKLKSLVAMAAAKTLVSTANGVRGIPGTSGIHFIACDTPDSMVRAMVAHFTDPEISAPMAEAGRRLIRDEYGESKLDAKAIPLLERFCSGQTLSRGDGTGM